MRGKVTIETIRKEREAIIITEIPYQVNKATMVERIAELVQAKRRSRASRTCATNPTATATAWSSN